MNVGSDDMLGIALRATGDVAAYSITFATILNLLPPLAALVSIVWIGYQFYFSEPMRAWRAKRRKETDGTL